MRKIALAPVLLAALALVAGVAVAADRQPVKFNAADQAAARAVVLKKADFGLPTGWSGGLKKPDFTPVACNGYEPKRSDLLVTGAASSEWTHASGLVFASEVWVMKTPAMGRLDWQRTVDRRDYFACVVRRQISSDKAGKFVSFAQVAFPRVGERSRRYRLLFDYTADGQTVRLMMDSIFVLQGRTELTFTAFGPYAARGGLDAAEVRLVRTIVARARA